MSRDNDVFFIDEFFPHEDWEELLGMYNAIEQPADDLDSRHLIARRWWIATPDASGVALDLGKLAADRHSFPDGYHWRISVHASTGTLAEWFLYAIPIIASTKFSDTIFWDPHPPRGFVTCETDGIVRRAEKVVPTRCSLELLAHFGYIAGNSMWPFILQDRKTVIPTEHAQIIARKFSDELGAEFYRT